MLDLQKIQYLYKKYRLRQKLPRLETCEEWWNKMQTHFATTHNRGNHVMMNPEGTCNGDGQENDDD